MPPVNPLPVRTNNFPTPRQSFLSQGDFGSGFKKTGIGDWFRTLRRFALKAVQRVKDYRPGVRPLALMQLLKTSALEPATPAIAASRSHSYASRPKVFVLLVSSCGPLPSLSALPVSTFTPLLSLVVLRLPVGVGGKARGATHPAKRIIAAINPNFINDAPACVPTLR